MYQQYFGFTAAPFSIAPDPRYLYMSERHQEALATLLYGLRSDGGFVLLTGEVGAGKTTICRRLLEQIPESCDVAYLFNPKLTVTELLSTLCDEFGIAYPAGATSNKRFVDLINRFLLESHARGRRAVLIIDEAQNLSADVLEQIRLLTNLETNERKLLQILLLGQPELVDMLARPELRQLAQRIVARYHLMPLCKFEVAAYVKHRLEVAGAQWPLFPDGLWGPLHRLSGGVPRVINVLCDRALLGAFVQRKQQIDRATLRQAAREVLPFGMRRAALAPRWALAGATLALAGAFAVSLYRGPWDSNSQAALPRPAALPILELPQDVPNAQSRQLAFATLFHKWSVAYREGDDPCAQAAAQGLRCRTLRGGLDELRKLNTPVILHLVDAGGQPFYAALTGLGEKSAIFSFGAQTREVSLRALALQWRGDYTMLLRVPQEVSEQIPPGAQGAAAAWLSKQLARLEDFRPAAGDDALRDRVARFQLAHGLPPDGVVGRRTLAHLSVAADPSVPRLSGAGSPAAQPPLPEAQGRE